MTDPGGTSTKLQKMQYWADTLNASNVGYDQDQRYTFLDKANRDIIWNKECDCSSSCTAIAWLAGYGVDLATYTGNFAEHFKAAGFKVIDFDKSKIAVGDFILTVKNHHVVFVRDSKRWWSAIADENGNTTGGKAGDQGSECLFVSPYGLDNGHWEKIIKRP